MSILDEIKPVPLSKAEKTKKQLSMIVKQIKGHLASMQYDKLTQQDLIDCGKDAQECMVFIAKMSDMVGAGVKLPVVTKNKDGSVSKPAAKPIEPPPVSK